MSSENFVKGDSIFTMLQISFISGAMFNISSLSVEITPPDLGSSLEEIVPPVIIIATFGRDLFSSSLISICCCLVAFSSTLASMISLSRIPML